MSDYIIDIDQNGIVWFTINREDRRNAINYEIMKGLEEVLQETRNNNKYKALVISGAGEKSFCSGGDLSVFHQLKTESQAYSMLSRMAKILYDLFTLPKPTIANINGIAIGGGCEIATACDFRIASSNSKVGFVQGNLGITTGWGGATMLFEKLVYDKAMKLLLSAKIITADEALEMGFIHKIIPNLDIRDKCEEFVLSFVLSQGEVLKAYKEVAIHKFEANDTYSRMVQEVKSCSKLWETEAHHQAVEKFLSKKRS
ncbi:enoyl-CoA hydratase/isomerase family protein [Bacillus timonensis]|nr:enoyl-CoA hydratase/isomerase family protein [Bacillus timonensis]